MQFRGGKFVRTDIWREGEYLDLWSVPHFLSGMVLGFLFYFAGFGTVPSILIALLLLTAYEMFEIIVKIQETKWNRFFDVVVGMASFVPTYLFATGFSTEQNMILFAAVCMLDGTLSFFGWRESQKAHVLEQTVRERLKEERRKLRERRARRRLRRMGIEADVPHSELVQ